MTGTLPGADVRGFYQALGIELSGWAQREASVACFAAPDAHAHGDRDPSCSVNVETGAWHCWGWALRVARMTQRSRAAWTRARRLS